MEEERDLVVFEDDNGNQITMEVLDYLFYEGKEYALLTEAVDDDEADEGERDAFVMEVVPVDDDMEEFVPIADDLAEKLIDIMENSDYDEEDYEEEDIEDE